MSAREIFSLIGSITVNGAEVVKKNLNALESQFVQMDRSLVKLGQQTAKAGATLSKNVTAPIIAMAASLGLATSKTIENADALLKMNAASRLNTDTLQEFKHVANMKDVNFDNVIGSITKLTKKMAGFIDEGGKPYETMEKLGVSVKDANGHIKGMNQLFPELIAALQGVNEETRNQMAMEIFGNSIKDLAPILDMSSSELAAMRKEAHDLGLVIKNEDLQATNAFGDEVEKLKEQFGAVTMKIASDFIPVLRDDILPIVQNNIIPAIQAFAGKIQELASWFRNMDGDTKKTILGFIGISAALGPALLLFGKTVLAMKQISGAITLASEAVMVFAGKSLPFLMSPLGIAVIGATGLIALLIKIKQLQSEKDSNDAITAKNEAINKQIQEFKELEAVQQTIIQTGEASHFSLYSKEQVEEAKANLASTRAALKTFLKDSGVSVTPGISPTPDAPKTSKSKAQPNDEYKQKLLEQNKTELALLEVKRMQAIDLARKEKKSVLEVEQWFEGERDRIIKEQAAKDAEAAEKEVELAKKTAEEKVAVSQSWADKVAQQVLKTTALIEYNRNRDLAAVGDNADAKIKINEYYNAVTAEANRVAQDTERSRMRENVQGWLGAVQTLVSGISSLMQQATDNKIMMLENERDAEIEAINRSQLSEAQKKKKIDALNADTAKKEKELKRQAAKDQKALAIMSAIVGTAVAVTSALGNSGNPILGIVMAAIVGALGIAQIAMIASQPIPFGEGGLIKGGKGGVQGLIGETKKDEIILPVESGIMALADGIVQRIGSFIAPQSGPMFAGAGGGSFGGGSGGVHLHIGTFIGDDRSLKELERKLEPLRAGDSKRRGG